MHKQRLFVLIAAIAGVIAVFLPWQTVSAGAFGFTISNGANGFQGPGVLAVICFVVTAVLAFSGDQASHLARKSWLGVLACAVVAFNGIMIFIVQTLSNDDLGFMELSIGLGCYIALVATIAIAAAAWLLKGSGQNLKESLEMLKEKISSIKIPQSGNADSSESSGLSKIEETERLAQLKDAGHITEEEYQQMKSKLL